MIGPSKDIRAAWSVAFKGEVEEKASRRGHFLTEGLDSLLYELAQIDGIDSSLWYVNRLNTKGGVQQSNKNITMPRANGSRLTAEAMDFKSTLDTGWNFVVRKDTKEIQAAMRSLLVKLNKDLVPVMGRSYLPNGFQQAEG